MANVQRWGFVPSEAAEVRVHPGPLVMQWDGDRYDREFEYVSESARDLVALLKPRAGERILDLGCGTGNLTSAIASSGADVVGIDNSLSMLNRARKKFPALDFRYGDANELGAIDIGTFHAVFSNAALHWMLSPRAVVRQVAGCLRPDGRFVSELGAAGNVSAIARVIAHARSALGLPTLSEPWYFPAAAGYASILGDEGFRVLSIREFKRPTKLLHGIRSWVSFFGQTYVRDVPVSLEGLFWSLIEETARRDLFRDGAWYADYRRLRFVARHS